ncbi:glycosyltransferase family 2 protein [Flavobacteriaceae bacterium M23B6Z8]
MSPTVKISIIIPTYNRASLIAETLDTILAQTFTDWECILVDDHSTDRTAEVLEAYTKKDVRIQWVLRPEDRPKGANACRNYGLELSNGEFIQWFDSDDLMLPDFLRNKISFFKSSTDCVISKCRDLHNSGDTSAIKKYQNNENNDFTFKNYLRGTFFCFTPDLMIRKNKVIDTEFNEHLQSGQEYHFFLKLLAFSRLQTVFINKELTLRRIHDGSVQELQKKDQLKVAFSKCFSRMAVLNDTSEKIDPEDRIYLINEIILNAYILRLNNKEIPFLKDFLVRLNKEKGFLKKKAFDIAMFLAANYKKGYKLMNYARS